MEQEQIQVLLVEDNSGDARLIEEALKIVRKPRYELTCARSLREARELLPRIETDVILLDLGLPDSRGFETFLNAKRVAGEIPIVVLSGLDDEDLALKAVEEGAQDYLVKGVAQLEILSRTIQYAIGRKNAEDRARATEDLLRLVTDAVPALISYIDASHRYRFNNEAYEKWFGRSTGDIYGRCVCEILDWDLYDQIRPYMERALKGERVSFDTVVRTTGGRERTVHVTYVPHFADDGTVPGFYSLAHDITERKRAEDEIRLLQSLALAIGVATDLSEAMSVTLRKICEVTGWDYGEAWVVDADEDALRDEPIWHSSSPALDEFQTLSQGTRFVIGQGLPGRVWATKQPEWVDNLDDESVFLRGSAARKTGLKAGVAFPVLSGDDVVAVMAFFMTSRRGQDRRQLDLVKAAVATLGPVIERRRTEDALAESERRTREMLERVELAAVMLDRKGNISFCNDFLAGITGYDREAMIGENWFDLFVPPDAVERVRRVFDEGIQTGTIKPHVENAILTVSGAKRIVAWNNTVLRDPMGRVIGVTGIGVDITDQRRNEAELARYRQSLEELVAERTKALETSHERLRLNERLASIGTLAAGLGHDINNVLFPVRCRLDSVQSAELPWKVKDELREVRHSIDYLQQLTDGLRLLALDPDDPAATSGVTCINDWWEQVHSLLSKSIPKTATFEVDLPPDLPCIAVAPHRLTQAVLNLVVNAGEAISGDGWVRIWADTLEDGRFIRLGVSDDGCGMASEVMRQALDPFFTTKKRGLSTGLGLSLVRGFASSSGGSVDIESRVGGGTTVILTLPVTQDGEGPADHESLIATVSLTDARIAALVSTWLQSSGVRAERVMGAPTSDADLWIVSPDGDLAVQAREFLDADANRQLVVVGAGAQSINGSDHVRVVPNQDDLPALRSAIRDAMFDLTGERE